MKIPFQLCLMTFVCLKMARQVTVGRIQCYTRLDEDRRSCLTEGKFWTDRSEDCCAFANATGFTDTSSWGTIPEYFNLQKKIFCESCTTAFESTKNWCFAYRNPTDKMCVHIPNYSTLPAQNERDCCLWANATGYADAPDWRWSNDYGRYYTTCNSCTKDRYVTCYAIFREIAILEPSCDGAQQRLAMTSNECCRRRNVTGYAPMEGVSGGRMCLPCPVDGGWSPWSVWSQCSATCGDSVRRRQRRCDSPTPRFGGTACFGSQEQREACRVPPRCSGAEMATTKTGVIWPDPSGIWSRWSMFSECSVSCGMGMAERRRICLTVNNQRLLCRGDSYETQPCKIQDCPSVPTMAGLVNQTWSSWSPCHVSCGSGIRTRVKMCSDDASDTSNGTKCTDDEPEMEVCHQAPCDLLLAQNQTSSSAGLIAAWSITALVCTALLVGIAIFSCRKWRCCQQYDPRFLGEHSGAGSQSPHKVRCDRGQLPPIPPTAPTPHYSSMTDLNRRYVPDPYNRPDSCMDDDGYEIPRPYDDSPNGHTTKPPLPVNLDHTSITPPLQSWDSALMLNHVYEQVDFDIDHVTHTGLKARMPPKLGPRC